MKNWFKNLDSQTRKTTLIVMWIITVVLFFAIGFTPDNSAISIVLVWLWIGTLTLSIIISAWSAKFKKDENNE